MDDVNLSHCPYCPQAFRFDERAVRFVHVQAHRKGAHPIPDPQPLKSSDYLPVGAVWDKTEERWIDRKDPSR